MSTTGHTAVQGAPASMPLEVPDSPAAWAPTREQLEVSASAYRWTARLFGVLENVLRVNFKLHGDEQIGDGQIFLFNHFARFETFIPQYFFYKESGAYSRSIASSEFFRPDDAFSDYLLSVGAVPNRLPDLLPYLAGEALRGRKVIVFPEGGIVKDRRVVDEGGRYAVYSRTSDTRRKHHSGAAVLALGLDTFKHAVMSARQRRDRRRLGALAESVEMEVDALIEACRKPTVIVPSNITFYPIRVGENLLSKGAELVSRGLSRRMSEELMIEGNILLKDTDMDIRLGAAVEVTRYWRLWSRPILERAARRLRSINTAFDLEPRRGPPSHRALALVMRRETAKIRDDYMHRMYTSVSVNLSHLASALIIELVDRDRTEVSRREFEHLLYRVVKAVQRVPDLHLHRSIRVPDAYADLPDGECAGLDQLMATAMRSGLIEEGGDGYRFLPKLSEEHHFDQIRLENPVEVYANEVRPLHHLRRALMQVVSRADRHTAESLALYRAHDESMAYHHDRDYFRRPRFQSLNENETATVSGEPFLLEGDGSQSLGVVLAHGFLASPAEMRGLAEVIHARGHTVYGVRLKGHGTSPHDLRTRACEEWLASVRRGIRIVSGLAQRVAVVGFSTGGSLALHTAGEAGMELAGVCAICVPVRFQNPHMRYVPLVHRANRLVRSMSSLDAVKAFTPNASENPEINYQNMPVRGLYELRRLVDAMLERVADIRCPVCLVQATEDPVVVPDSIDTLRERITGARVESFLIDAEHHGIVYRNEGETWSRVLAFLEKL